MQETTPDYVDMAKVDDEHIYDSCQPTSDKVKPDLIPQRPATTVYEEFGPIKTHLTGPIPVTQLSHYIINNTDVIEKQFQVSIVIAQHYSWSCFWL